VPCGKTAVAKWADCGIFEDRFGIVLVGVDWNREMA
jgi:hypothetical protein